VLRVSVRQTAQSIVQLADEDQLSARFNELLAFTVADASRGSIQTDIRQLDKYRALGETARTDKQLGATARSQGSTSAIQKPGLLRLLGFAIENGAIQQEIRGTSLTLSTSPYAVIAAIEGDTDETYRNYELFNRLNASATFNLTNQDIPLENVNTKQLTEWSARVRLTGDRSTRSEKFQEFWNREIVPAKQFRLDVNARLRDTIVNDPAIIDFANPAEPNSLLSLLKAQIKTFLANNASDTVENRVEGIENIILCGLKNSVYDPIKNGTISLSSNTLTELNTGLGNLQQAHLQIAEARRKLSEFLEQFQTEGTLSTFEYTNYRQNGVSDYSTLRILFERNVSPVTVVANAGISIYNDPDPMRNQERVRDFVAALSFEAASRSPFLDPDEDLSKITYAFTGRYQRLMENEGMPGRQPDIAVANFKVDIPIAYGLRIPISFTYASATELSARREFRANFGLTLDMDKLISITRGF
jgi:hypothetical protein